MDYNYDQLVKKITAAVRNELNRKGYMPLSEFSNSGKSCETSNAESSLLNKRVITEETVKKIFKNGSNEILVLKKAIITPLAKDFILHNGIKLIRKE